MGIDLSKCTRGPCTTDEYGYIWAESVGGSTLEMSPFAVAQVRGWGHLRYLPDGAEIQDANAELIADAFNVHTKTGLSPSELAKRVEALLDVVKWVAKQPIGDGLEMEDPCECEFRDAYEHMVRQARECLAAMAPEAQP